MSLHPFSEHVIYSLYFLSFPIIMPAMCATIYFNRVVELMARCRRGSSPEVTASPAALSRTLRLRPCLGLLLSIVSFAVLDFFLINEERGICFGVKNLFYIIFDKFIYLLKTRFV